MNWTQEIDCLQKAIPFYFNVGLFVVFHWIRMFLGWWHKTCIQPFERFLQSYNKAEPTEKQWIQIYTTSQSCDGDLGGTDPVFKSSEKYFFPYTTNFIKFIDNEFQFFLNNSLIGTAGENIIENLFIVKNNTQYVVRSYPVFQKILSPVIWEDFPKKSGICFAFIEYCHPKMARPLEIVLPSDYYTIGNELFTNAFVLRQLELMNCYFVFDSDYEIHFVDHDINETHLKSHQFIEIKEDGYIVKSRDNGDGDCGGKKDIGEKNDLVVEEDDTSIVSETRYWWH